MTKAEKEARRAWLASLKEGDKVAVQAMERGKPRGVPDLHTVTVVANSYIHTRGGHSRDRSVRWDAATGSRPKDAYGPAFRIEPVTEAHLRSWHARKCKERLCGEFSAIYRCTVSDDKAIRMCAILDEELTQAKGGE